MKRGNVDFLRELARSPLTAETSRFGQEIRMLAERTPESPVRIIQDIMKGRTERIEKSSGKKTGQLKSDTIKDIKSEIRKNTSKRPTWEEFMENLTCKI